MAAVNPHPAVVGRLRCQTDPFLQSLETQVYSCDGSPEKGYKIEFLDTVLFPEGGGQPYDLGTVWVKGEAPVQIDNVQREGVRAVHFAKSPLSVGSNVTMSVDWQRRWDLMQQHTGQHLLSAVLDTFEIQTIGWGLGVGQSYVELSKKLSHEEVSEVESLVNARIREARPITISYPENDGGIDHHVPEDYDLEKGVLRVVTIEGLEDNPCCGTHLTSTAAIQAVSLLHQVPNKGNSRLFFIAGQRVIDFADTSNKKQKDLCSLLSCQPDEIEDKVEILQAKNKVSQSFANTLESQLAELESKALRERASESHTKLGILHTPSLGLNFLKKVAKNLEQDDSTYILLSGELGQPGAVVITGPDTAKYGSLLGSKLSTLKGGGKKTWQGKVQKYGKGEIQSILELAHLDLGDGE